ncbi:MAG: hypothetical protein LBO82_06560 [Synergistaceae bacterium]|jgi:hypothetical protein|nr:hypothetical protein [Synergistaceae bacterium]
MEQAYSEYGSKTNVGAILTLKYPADLRDDLMQIKAEQAAQRKLLESLAAGGTGTLLVGNDVYYTGPEFLNTFRCGRGKLKQLVAAGAVERDDSFGKNPRYRWIKRGTAE